MERPPIIDFFAALKKGTWEGSSLKPPESTAALLPKTGAQAEAAPMPMSDALFHRRIAANFCYISLIVATVIFVVEVFFAWTP